MDEKTFVKEKSRLVRKRHTGFSVWRPVIAAVLCANSGLVIARFDGVMGYIASAVLVLSGLFVMEKIRMRSNMYRDLLHSFSKSTLSSRIAHELSEHSLWDDQDDRRQYEQLVEKWGDKWVRGKLKVEKSVVAMKSIKPGGK